MKNTLMIGLKSTLILLLGTIVGIVLLVLAYCIPVKDEIARDSFEVRQLEGEYPIANVLNNHAETYFTSFEPAVLDNVTDVLMMKNIFNTEEKSPLFLAMDMNDYPRYWHGYVAILRPLFHIIEYQDFRVLNGFIQISLVFLIAMAIWKHMGQKRYVLAFMTSYAFLMPMALPYSLQYTSVFYIAFGGILFAIYKKDYLLQKSRYVYFFLLLGMLTSYFDLLTYPLVTWGFPLIWWIVVSKDAMDVKERFKNIVVTAISWIAGYGIFWFLKWAISSFILGYNVISSAFEEIFYRVGEVDEYAKGLLQAYNRWEVYYINWRHFEYSIYGVILAAWMIWAIYQNIRRGWKVELKSIPLLIIGCSSVVWYTVLSNHTTIHHFFTYRIYGVSILAFLVFLVECVPQKDVCVQQGWKTRLISLAKWGVFGVMGLALSMLAKEDISAIYGIEYQELELEQGSVLETTFVPTFSEVKKIGFCLTDEEGEGYYYITVLKDGEVLYEEEIPLLNHVNVAYYVADVDWDLKAQEDYAIQFSIYDNKSCKILITNPGNMPLNEYNNLRLDDILLEGQPLGGITYHARVQSRLKLAYAALMWMIVFGSAAASAKMIWENRKRK